MCGFHLVHTVFVFNYFMNKLILQCCHKFLGAQKYFCGQLRNMRLTLARGLPPVAVQVSVKLAPSAYAVVMPFFTTLRSSVTWTPVGGTVTNKKRSTESEVKTIRYASRDRSGTLPNPLFSGSPQTSPGSGLIPA